MVAQMQASLFILVYTAVSVLTAVIPVLILAWCIWLCTKRFSPRLRFQVTAFSSTFLAALLCKPIGIAEGGSAVPLGLILFLHGSDFVFSDSASYLRDQVVSHPMIFLCLWVIFYLITIVVARVRDSSRIAAHG